jgi:acetate kinase
MTSGSPNRILTLNSGSSTLKFAVYAMEPEALVLAGSIDRIGLKVSHFQAHDSAGAQLADQHLHVRDHDDALRTLLGWIRGNTEGDDLDAIGHRIVHGGGEYYEPHEITPHLMEALRQLVPLAPDHLPHELAAIEAARRVFPGLRQVACFDTAFHRRMPKLAQMYPLPRFLWHEGAIRYGFHGLSYEYIMTELEKLAGREVADGRVIIAHLGNGASMVACKDGGSLDTTMGFTPAGGLMMSTRSGDLDPGVILYLLEHKNLKPAAVSDIVNQQAGLLGVSGITSDMKELLRREDGDPHAAEAVELFCYQARKFLGALAAVLGGLDTLVFTAGIGENAPSIRWRICQPLEFLGIQVDSRRNEDNSPIISPDGAPVTVRVMRTDEQMMIARHTHSLLRRRERGANRHAQPAQRTHSGG